MPQKGHKTRRKLKGGIWPFSTCMGSSCVKIAPISVVPTIAQEEELEIKALEFFQKLKVKVTFQFGFIKGANPSDRWNDNIPLNIFECITFTLDDKNIIGKITKFIRPPLPERYGEYISHIEYAPWNDVGKKWDALKKISFFKGEENTGDCTTIKKVPCPTRFLDAFGIYKVGDVVLYKHYKWSWQGQPHNTNISKPKTMTIIRIEANMDGSQLGFSDTKATAILQEETPGSPEYREEIDMKPNPNIIYNSKGGRRKRSNKTIKKSKKSKRTHRR